VWVVRLIVFVVLLVTLVYVFWTNAGQTVDLNLFGREFLDLGLFWVVVASFFLGLLAALPGMGLREIQLRRNLTRQRKENQTLERELADLRALPLQDLQGDKAVAKKDQ